MTRLLILVVSGLIQITVSRASDSSVLQTMEIRVDLATPEVAMAGEEMSDILRPVTVSAKGVVKTHAGHRSDVLYGDLFRDGNSYAVFTYLVPSERNGGAGLGLAAWDRGKWTLAGLWKIQPTWRAKGWKVSNEDYLPITPSTKPFWLEDLSGDGVPELVVAAEVEKYFQDHYLLKFDRKERRLHLVSVSQDAPEFVGGFLRLYSNSGRRAIYEEWEYCRWDSDRLSTVATWHDETPYNNVDSPFVEAVRWGTDGREAVRWKAAIADDLDENAIVYNLQGAGETGKLIIHPKKANLLPTLDPAVKRFLFQKMTGLPRSLYPTNRDSTGIRADRLESSASVNVSGSRALIKLFK